MAKSQSLSPWWVCCPREPPRVTALTPASEASSAVSHDEKVGSSTISVRSNVAQRAAGLPKSYHSGADHPPNNPTAFVVRPPRTALSDRDQRGGRPTLGKH